jgi:hypothetical protein
MGGNMWLKSVDWKFGRMVNVERMLTRRLTVGDAQKYRGTWATGLA